MRHHQLIRILVGVITISCQASPALGLENRPRSVLYISADPGCYSATFVSSSTVPTSPPKKLYPVSCFEKHHYEVFWSGQITTQPGNPIPERTASLNFCSERSKKVKVLGRNSSSYNYGPNETTGTGFWLPDKGPEAKRYPKRLVCYVGLSTNDFQYFKEISQPLLKGLR